MRGEPTPHGAPGRFWNPFFLLSGHPQGLAKSRVGPIGATCSGQQLLVLTNETSWQLRWAHSTPAGTASPRCPPYPKHPRKA